MFWTTCKTFVKEGMLGRECELRWVRCSGCMVMCCDRPQILDGVRRRSADRPAGAVDRAWSPDPAPAELPCDGIHAPRGSA
jgi:hypothetical protein